MQAHRPAAATTMPTSPKLWVGFAACEISCTCRFLCLYPHSLFSLAVKRHRGHGNLQKEFIGAHGFMVRTPRHQGGGVAASRQAWPQNSNLELTS